MSQAAKSIDGVKDCKADYKQGTAQVTFLPAKTTPEIIAKVIANKTGYKVAVPKGRAPRIDKLVLLTRQGCVNTITMRKNLDAALTALSLPKGYQFIDADTLAASDPRGGYGTPTILYDNRDLFGLPEPPVPHPPPT